MTTLSEQNALIEDNLPYAYAIARNLNTNRGVVDLDDLRQSAALGLIEAARKFDPTRNSSFTGYANRRIYGACIDCIRKTLNGPRGKQFRSSSLDVEVQKSKDDRMISLIDTLEDPKLLPDALTFREEVKAAIKDLPENERIVLTLFYYEGLTGAEIGKIIHRDKSRAHQLLCSGRQRLRKRLRLNSELAT